MAKRVLSMGVQKTKIIKRKTKEKKKKKNGGVLKKLIDYLKSDDYMFAPLFSSSLPNSISPTSTGVDTEEPFEENDKKLLVKVGEYLKSDCHMYAPLVLDQPSLSTDNSEVNPQTGPKEAAATTPAEKVTEKSKQPAKQATNTFGEYHESASHPLPRTVVRQTVSYRQEAVKHIVHQHCRSSSGTGAVLETTGKRNVVVE